MREAGSVALTCDAVGGRSRLREIRSEGLSRSSRAFAAPFGAIRLVLSTLGPGVLAGDHFTVSGSVSESASLLACGQMATPVFAGASPSQTDAGWHVADGASLIVAGEPLLLEPHSTHGAEATFTIEGSGTALVVDTFGLRGTARLSMRTHATLDGALVYRDAYDIAGNLDGAFGTVAFVSRDHERREALLERARALMQKPAASVRIGTGRTSCAVIVRIHGARVWDVRAAALAIAGVTSP